MDESTTGAGGAVLSAKGTRLNRRGLQTRRHLLRVALHCLAEGGPESVSANLVARQAGVTWGTVQHQFGDVDGLWAAVFEYVAVEGGPLFADLPEQVDLAERVEAVVDLLWNALELPVSRAIYQLRTALPQDRTELETAFPRTAKAIAAWDLHWAGAIEHAFAGLDVDRDRLARVRAMLPAAMRGLRVEQAMSTYVDIDAARLGLREAITVYLASDG
ncbi:TetR/AcrR family transcriptional regulator [Nocardioides lianchengensis]|uniref:DNA-binding transcriptional regulator, AcrR family n=1 Tax=Nocardioides lianchengensis TaxID=1045774 RepID=A0A1G6ZVR3_9ACTN|nr:TetR/AcrR family transcriptional regulator [Nocardioides lianchengensis]NYG12240.1 AcrR family transcriptional regulator [Nocardioides lianchengensis]SDE06443.1 DNA-binding transcriptional regulator, AcrR family [Nocardioides lianchengensis]